jgi:hypothetical protein
MWPTEALYRLVDAAYETRLLAFASKLHPSPDDQTPGRAATADRRSSAGHAGVRIREGDTPFNAYGPSNPISLGWLIAIPPRSVSHIS